MQKTMKSWGAVGLAIVGICLAGPAAATTLTLSQVQIAEFTQLDVSDAAILTFQTSPSDFTILYMDPVTGDHYADVGLAGLAIGWADGDTFELNVANNNEHAWTFALWTETFLGVVAGPEVTIAVGANANVGVMLSAADFAGAGDIERVWLRVTSPIGIPNTNNDRTAEFRVAPVPEPSAAAVFAFGTLVVAGSVRRQSLRSAR